MIALLLISAVRIAHAGTCNTANDYLHVVGSYNTDHQKLITAPNFTSGGSLDLLIAGTYTEKRAPPIDILSTGDDQLFVYLFQESTCSYLWHYNGAGEAYGTKYINSLAWSIDQSKAYMLSSGV